MGTFDLTLQHPPPNTFRKALNSFQLQFCLKTDWVRQNFTLQFDISYHRADQKQLLFLRKKTYRTNFKCKKRRQKMHSASSQGTLRCTLQSHFDMNAWPP
jgi:hypothetical protein